MVKLVEEIDASLAKLAIDDNNDYSKKDHEGNKKHHHVNAK
ncbi:MAG TPA: hypothetical protein VKA09_01770 [Nitrososphaeraceae archaeon]|nr:hypothetical protein [Nitrososphaeraceae archaeon]